ncbi:MAG: DUF167 domain-containing protein [Candidatus Omnitrophota bacterium]|nr:DUF167 domain-containing protein [Candidatus Omnitrophota bacterium]
MRIGLKVIAGAKRERLEKISEASYRIKVASPPEKGRANKRVIELLAAEFGVRKRDIIIVSGETGNKKILEINK